MYHASRNSREVQKVKELTKFREVINRVSRSLRIPIRRPLSVVVIVIVVDSAIFVLET